MSEIFDAWVYFVTGRNSIWLLVSLSNDSTNTTAHLLSGRRTGLRWQRVASSMTACEGGPSSFFTASRTTFWDFSRSSIWVVNRNCRPRPSRNLRNEKSQPSILQMQNTSPSPGFSQRVMWNTALSLSEVYAICLPSLIQATKKQHWTIFTLLAFNHYTSRIT